MPLYDDDTGALKVILDNVSVFAGPAGPAGPPGTPGSPGADGGGIVWTGPWTAGAYSQFDAVSHNGSSYIANTGTSDEPPGPDWDVLAAVADGDLEAANNLSDVASAATSFNNIKQAATTSATGVVELATTTETVTGTDTVRAVTPDSLAALWEKGTSVAYAGTITLGDGGVFHITSGSGPCNDIDFSTAKDGRSAILVLDTDATFTNSSTLKILGGDNWVGKSGDHARVFQDNGDTVYLDPYNSLRTPAVLNRRWPRLSDYAPSDDTQECFSATRAFLTDAAYATHYEFDSPILGPARVYRYLDRTLSSSTSVFTLPSGRVANWNSICDFSAYSKSGTRKRFFEATGTLSATAALASTANTGDETITLVSGSVAALGLTQGDIILISADNLFSPETAAAPVEERQFIRAISGEVLTFYGKIRGEYTTGNSAVVRKVTPWTGKIQNPWVLGPGRWTGNNAGDYGMRVQYGLNVLVEGGNFRNCDAQNFLFKTSFDSLGLNIRSVQDDDGTNDQPCYGLVFTDGCEDTYFRDCHAYGGRHGFVQTVGGEGVTRNFGFIGGSVHSTFHYGVAVHGNCERFEVSGVTIEDCNGGIDNRVGKAHIHDNKIRHLARTTPQTSALGAGINLRLRLSEINIHDNIIEDVIYGIRLGGSEIIEVGPYDLDISNNTIRDASNKGIDITYDEDTTTKYRLKITGNNIKNTGNNGISIYGKFDSPVVSWNKFDSCGGGSAACVYLTGNGTGNGPIDADVSYNRYRLAAAPLITNATGTTTTTDNRAQ